MASFKKVTTRSGTVHRAQIAITGAPRESASFSTKAEAVAWAAERETEIRRMVKTGINTDKTVQDAFDRYIRTVSAHKKGKRWEEIRLRAIASHEVDGVPLGTLKLSRLTADTLGLWRDNRIAGTKAADFKDKVKGSTVIRDMNLLSHVFNTARTEWKWLATSPTASVRRPKNSKARDRLITDDEIERQCLALGYADEVTTKSQRVAAAFLFAIETAMRAGEICALEADWLDGSVAHLPAATTKNGSARDVPLTERALEIIASLPPDESPLFGITTASLDALFRKAKSRAAIENMTFHDARHLAITRLAKKLNVLELARMVGHRNLNELQTYYNESALEMAKKLR